MMGAGIAEISTTRSLMMILGGSAPCCICGRACCTCAAPEAEADVSGEHLLVTV